MLESKGVLIAIIVAMARNRVIGCDNQLPWHLPNDLKFFKARTMGKPIVMGRKTFESIGRPLPGRSNIVVTRDDTFGAEGVSIAHSAHDALRLARQIADADGVTEIMVIGGAQLYTAMLPEVDRLYLTQVHAEVPGDALFPVLDWKQWSQVSREDHLADGRNNFNYSFTVFDRN
ncbi:MAG: dihydrofolate reductase [Spongiibacteraceae bacterium]|nr:dihydrofolate reductase [Spongiibacteraceae bacterium]